MRKTMWNNWQKPLLALSIGLNAAFIALWLAHAVPELIADQKKLKSGSDDAAVPSIIHRQIGVKPEQWEQIGPHVRDFQRKAKDQRRMIRALRGQLMELLASPTVDERAIKAKQEEILSGQRQMQNFVIELLLKEKEILTPEQQRALLEVIHQHCNCGEEDGSYGRGIGRVLSNDESTRSGENNRQ